jgi:hypothetical protein
VTGVCPIPLRNAGRRLQVGIWVAVRGNDSGDSTRHHHVVGWLVWLVISVCILCSCTPTSTSGNHEARIAYGGLTHRIGAYGVGTEAAQVLNASRLGIRLLVGRPITREPQYREELQRVDMQVIDNTPQRMIYRTVCPRGTTRCAVPSDETLVALRERLAEYVRSRRALSNIAGYYILDDYVPRMNFVLRSVYKAMREADPARPLVCAFSLPIVPKDAGAAIVNSQIGVFRRNLTNYSPRWCNAVMLFSYAPSSRIPARKGPYDWKMAKTLPRALSILRGKGWGPSQSPLIGVPQAFEFWPRREVAGSIRQTQFREGPDSTELATQVAAFCQAGAVAIVAYAWRTAVQPTVKALYNSGAFQLGLLAGAQRCQRDSWG